VFATARATRLARGSASDRLRPGGRPSGSSGRASARRLRRSRTLLAWHQDTKRWRGEGALARDATSDRRPNERGGSGSRSSAVHKTAGSRPSCAAACHPCSSRRVRCPAGAMLPGRVVPCGMTVVRRPIYRLLAADRPLSHKRPGRQVGPDQLMATAGPRSALGKVAILTVVEKAGLPPTAKEGRPWSAGAAGNPRQPRLPARRASAARPGPIGAQPQLAARPALSLSSGGWGRSSPKALPAS
jgi:hypothetical protein